IRQERNVRDHADRLERFSIVGGRRGGPPRAEPQARSGRRPPGGRAAATSCGPPHLNAAVERVAQQVGVAGRAAGSTPGRPRRHVAAYATCLQPAAIATIVSDQERAKTFYTDVLGGEIELDQS